MDEPPDPETPTTPNSLSSIEEYDELARDDAKLLLDQVRYLLDDQRDYAKKLVDDRKLKIGLIGVFVGLGLFRTTAFHAIRSTLYVNWFVSVLVVILMLISILGLVISLILIVTERDPITRRFLGMDGAESDARSSEQTETAGSDAVSPVDPRNTFSAALAVLYADDRAVDSLPDECANIQERIVEFRTAFVRLAHANRRVRKRLELGTFFFVVAVVAVILLFVFVAFFGNS